MNKLFSYSKIAGICFPVVMLLQFVVIFVQVTAMRVPVARFR